MNGGERFWNYLGDYILSSDTAYRVGTDGKVDVAEGETVESETRTSTETRETKSETTLDAEKSKANEPGAKENQAVQHVEGMTAGDYFSPKD